MAKNITLMGANYPDVPAVDLPQTGGGTARFVAPEEYIKSMNISDTTDGGGDINTGLSGANKVPIAFKASSPSNALLFYEFGFYGSVVFMKFLNDNNQIVTNQAIAGILYYIEV